MSNNTTVNGLNVKFRADSVQFDEGVKGMNSAIRLLKVELTNVNQLLKMDPTNVDLLKRKLDTLQESSRVAKLRLAEYQKELSELDATEVGSQKWQSLQKQISNSEREIAQFDNQVKETETQLKSVETTGGKAFEKIEQKAGDAAKKVVEVGKSVEKVGDALMPVTAAITGTFAIGIAGASDLTEATNKANVAFGESADILLEFTKNADSNFGETQAKVLDTAATYGLLGLSVEKTTELIQRSADVGSLQNKTFEEVSRDFISGMNGSTEAVEKYGIKLKQADLQQFLVEKGMFSTRKEAGAYLQSLDSSGKQLIMYEKILHDTSNAEGDLQNNIGTFAVGSKVLLAELKSLATELGQRLLPFMEQGIATVRGLVKGFDGLSESKKDLIVKIMLVVAALSPMLIMVGKLMQFVPTLQKGFMLLKGTLIGTTMPIWAIVAVVTTLIAIFTHLYTTNEAFRLKMNEIATQIGQFVSGVLNVLVVIFRDQIIPLFMNMYLQILPIFEKAFLLVGQVISEYLVPIFNSLWTIIKVDVIPIIIRLWEMFNKYVIPVIVLLANIIFDVLLPTLLKMWGWFADRILPILESIAGFLKNVFIGLFKALSGILEFVISIVIELYEGFIKLFDWFLNLGPIKGLISMFQELGNIVDYAIGGIRWLLDSAGSIAKDIGGILGSLGNSFGDTVGGFFDSGGTGSSAYASGGIGTLSLSTSINVNHHGEPIDENQIRQWGRTIADVVSDELGRRV